MAEVKALARALIGFETYDTEPSALLQFVQDGERVIGQAIMDANPWVFTQSTIINVTTPSKQFSLAAYNPAKILTVGQASSGSETYQWIPALQPVEVMSQSPDAGGYNQPYSQGWAYVPNYLQFSENVPAGYDILVLYSAFPAISTLDADILFGGNSLLVPYHYLVAYHAAIAMAIVRDTNPAALVALHQTNLERVTTALKDLQVQAVTHIPQFNGRANW